MNDARRSGLLPGRFLTAAAVAALALAAAAAVTGGAAGPPGRELSARSVAVVDMARLLRQSQQWRDMKEEETRLVESMRRTLERLGRRGQILLNEYENMPPGTPQREAKARQLDEAEAELRRTEQQMQQEAIARQAESARAILDALGRAVRGYAVENGIALVLKKQPFAEGAAETAGENLLMATTEVLYADPSLDITDAVIARLNAEYAGPILDR